MRTGGYGLALRLPKPALRRCFVAHDERKMQPVAKGWLPFAAQIATPHGLQRSPKGWYRCILSHVNHMLPWNFPAPLPSRKIARTPAAGCAMVIKPLEETLASTIGLAQALCDAGLPKGVLNLVLGVPADTSSHLIQSETIKKGTFTGSTVVTGRRAGRRGCKPVCTRNA